MDCSFLFELVEFIQVSIMFGYRFFDVSEALADTLDGLVDCLQSFNNVGVSVK